MGRLSDPFSNFRVAANGLVEMVDPADVGQVSLFDQPAITGGAGSVLGPPRPTARRADPQTSHDAARSMTPGAVAGQKARVLAALVAFGGFGGTAAEITNHLCRHGRPVQQSVIARRCTDLHDLGLIATVDDPETGKPATRQGATGRHGLVWHLTDEGRAAAQEIAA